MSEEVKPFENLDAVVAHAKVLLENHAKFQEKPSKNLTAAIRKSMNEIKKAVTPAKLETLAFDKSPK